MTMHRVTENVVAVVGMACRLPGDITTPAQLWDALACGRPMITEHTPEHSRASILPAGILSEETWVDFDHAHFGFSEGEAAALDPQQRWGLELTEEALQNAGIAPKMLRGSDTGVWWGSSFLDQAITHLGSECDAKAMTMVDTAAALPSMAPGRISRAFDFRGPSELVDTACSASLVALHRARQSLLLGEIDVAMVGGANGLVLPTHTTMFRNSGAHTATGQVRPFDVDADGFVRGEGAVVVVLQRLADAHRAGTPVRAHVVASSTNNDGASPGGVGAPSHRAQSDLLERVYTSAGIDPGTVDYVHTHGTATPAGDNAERAALGRVLAHARTENPVWLGSTKSTVGHLEGAAGLVSLLATVLALQHKTIPPTAGHTTAMPQLQRNPTLRVPTQPVAWPARSNTGRLAGVSAAGFTGTNAHLILEEPPPAHPSQDTSTTGAAQAHLVPVSATNGETLATTAHRWASHLDATQPSLEQVAATAQHRRDHHRNRAVIVARTSAEATAGLSALGAGTPHPALVGPRATPRRCPRVVFVYPGHGHHHSDMGRRLAQCEPVYAQALKQVHTGFTPHLRRPPWVPDSGRALEGLHTTQPAAVAHQIALTALWAHWGLTPDAVIGHSAGEVAATHTAGILSLDQVGRLVGERSHLLEQASHRGTLALLNLAVEHTRTILADYPRLRLAALNGPRTCVIAGPHADLDHLCQRLTAEHIRARVIPDASPSHHPELMADLASTLSTRLQGHLQPHDGSLALYSTATGRLAQGHELDPAYWAHQLCAPVLLHPTIQALAQDGSPCVFVVVGARPVLATDLAETLADSPGYDATDPPIIHCDNNLTDEHTAWLNALAHAHTHAVPITWPTHPHLPATDLPPRAWARTPTPPPVDFHDLLTHATTAQQRRNTITAALTDLITPLVTARTGTPDLHPQTDLINEAGLDSLTLAGLRHKISRMAPELSDLPLATLLAPNGAITVAHLTEAIEDHLAQPPNT